jgi:PhnB protein
MKKLTLPENYQTVMPYLIVADAAGLSQFMKTVFEAVELQTVMRPGEDKIMHGEVKIGDSTIMFAECTEQWKSSTAGLYINVADADAAYTKALQQGATSLMPPADQPYGRSSGVKDPFGNTWWITTPV